MLSLKDYRLSKKNNTLLRYFLSYFILLSALLLSFFFASKYQFSKIYFRDINTQNFQKLENVVDWFNDGLTSVNRIHNSLIKNINIILSRYSNTYWYQYLADQKLDEYTLSNPFIDSIVYLDKRNEILISSGNYVKYDAGIFSIYNNASSIDFSLANYEEDTDNQLIFISDEDNRYLIYLPYNPSMDYYSVFYILSNKEIEDFLNTSISNSVLSMVLVDSSNQPTLGAKQSLLHPYLKDLPVVPTTDTYSIDSQTSVSVCSGICSNFSIASLISNEAIISQINTAFSHTYLIFILIGFLGLILIMGAMNFTYLPLYRLTKKIVTPTEPGTNYIQQLDKAFSAALAENQMLQTKIDHYKISMQKSILDSIVLESSGTSPESLQNLDQFFTMKPDNTIFVIYMSSSVSIFPREEILKFFQNILPAENTCVLLEYSGRYATFLVNYSGSEQNKEEVLLLYLNELFERSGFRSVISNPSSSPLEIPSLYENAVSASKYWKQKSVIIYSEFASSLDNKSNFSYPHKQLEELALHLKNHSFTQIHDLLDELFALINENILQSDVFSVFFIRCILIDILTAIITAMNQYNIKFKSYQDVYFEALFLCRSCPYEDENKNIYKHFLKLINIFETQVENSSVDPAQIRSLVQQNYTSPDFSISSIADTFQISVAYMSYVFKKEFNQNFSDYLWELRLKKAKELLTTTTMSIESVSISIGYINPSSFRRKFKQETGVTPSQYRDLYTSSQSTDS